MAAFRVFLCLKLLKVGFPLGFEDSRHSKKDAVFRVPIYFAVLPSICTDVYIVKSTPSIPFDSARKTWISIGNVSKKKDLISESDDINNSLLVHKQ